MQGFGKGRAEVELAEDQNATLLSYRVEGNVGGKLAQMGSRLITAAGRKMADGFFSKFSERWADTIYVGELRGNLFNSQRHRTYNRCARQ